MNIQDKNSLCMDALPYLFDVLSDVVNDVPAEILSHIRQCSHCRDEIVRLKFVLESHGPADDQQTKIDTSVAASLDLHYTYNGTMVGCGDIRAFLPSLTDPLLKIRVPTPITVHVDNCCQCAADFETIQQMQLTHKQLCRLGQVFAEPPAEDGPECAEAAKVIPFVARLDLASFSADVLKHLCTCPDCRTLLYEKRRAMLSGIWSQMQERQSPCRQVSASEIFDYVIPYGLDSQSLEGLESRQTFVSHVMSCPVCFGKVQEMHETLIEILERPESDTVTRFDISDAAESEKDTTSSLYANWPVKVEVFTHDRTVAAPDRFKMRLPSINLRPFIKPAAAAAVVLFVFIFYYLSTPIAHATDLAQIYKAVANIVNVHIASFMPKKTEPIQEQWVAKTRNIGIFKTPTESFLWDIANGSKRVKNIAAGTVEVTSLSRDVTADIRENIKGSLGLLPFNNLSQKPHDADWNEVADAGIATGSADVKVYDLTWPEKSVAGAVIFKKWRVFVDTKTNLPQRVEWYEKATASNEYILESSLVVDYLTESEIQAVIREAAF